MVDVAVVGGGPAGCAAAVTAARHGARVALVGDVRTRGRSWAGESLPPGADALVRSIFGTQVITAPQHRIAYGVRGAWGSRDLADTDFVAHPRGEGWHLDRAVFDRDLLRRAVDEGVRAMCGRVTVVARSRTGWTITDDSGHTVGATWLVDATGRAGLVARRFGIDPYVHDMQVALVRIFERRAPVVAATVIESEPDGWWYCTPLPGDRTVAAFLTDRDLVPPVPERTRWWFDKLGATEHIAPLVSTDVPAPPRLTAANTTSLPQVAGDRWVAVGDAAMAWDPLSSQGLVTGMLMGARVGQLIATAPSEIPAWCRDYQMLLHEHLDLRQHYWQSEVRWPDAPYWQRRRQRS